MDNSVGLMTMRMNSIGGMIVGGMTVRGGLWRRTLGYITVGWVNIGKMVWINGFLENECWVDCTVQNRLELTCSMLHDLCCTTYVNIIRGHKDFDLNDI